MGTFINYSDIIDTSNSEQTFKFDKNENGYIGHFINYGNITPDNPNTNKRTFYIEGDSSGIGTITNYGAMGGVKSENNANITIANYGVINLSSDNSEKYHFKSVNLVLQDYAMQINVDSATFNAFSGNASDNSHLILSSASVSFADKNTKLILDFGENFELGAGYLFSKLVVDTSGNNALGVDFYRLTPKNDIYTLYKQGDYFIVRLQPQHSTIANISKANIRAMNNFYVMSNAMIYPRKSYHSQNLGKKNPSLRDSALDSANHLKSYESFAYRNESINRRIQRQNKRNYNRKSQNLTTDSANQNNQNNSSLRADSRNLRGNPQNKRNPQNQRTAQNLTQNPHDYYFILTPFVNHNLFFESGRYNLSGFDYGFLTAFSARVAESNSLGAHFIFSYGSLGDKKDKDLSIKSLNLNFGLNYKLDLIWDMFIKARGDFYYFLNQAKTLTIFEAIKPNNLGFGASVAFGKDFDFKQGGVLGIEAGLDYKALQSSTISLQNNATKTISETYQKSLYNLIYIDLGLNYNKYFNSSVGLWGINTTLGIKGNITANKLATSKIRINNLNRNVDMVLDNDKILGYANLSASYVLNAKSFDMEFSLAYYGNYGDRVISNAGGFKWRVVW